VLDRRPVLHTLIALGVRPGQIAAAVVTEGCMLGAIGVALGLVAGVVVSRVIVLHSVPMINGWHFQYIFPGATAAGLCIASLAIAALAGIGPARLATRRQLAAPEGEE
jgi:ABC-type antimicrobial peptide transport system permease subunit